MKPGRRLLDTVTTALAAGILILAIPEAVREMLSAGRVYVLSADFLADLPMRITGPGKLRFILQPTIAVLLGIRSGLGDYRLGHPPYLHGLLFIPEGRHRRLREGFDAVRSLVAMGIVADAVSQWLIYGIIHPGAALVIGPVLICVPYGVARALTWRVLRMSRSG